MHRVFQNFIDRLAAANVDGDFFETLAEAATSLDLSCFAYLAPAVGATEPHLISNYPPGWTSHYLQNRYQEIDPVISEALRTPEPFRWGLDVRLQANSAAHEKVLEEAARFGIRAGFTVPIHDGRGPVAAMTFATDGQRATFEKCITAHARVLQLMALYFHARARRILRGDRVVDGMLLSRREFECLQWSARGKSAWEIGTIIGISRRTVSFHLDNVRAKLGVRTVRQAAVRLAESKSAQ